ncbi:MAG TPA: DEAD/DEAH box helicase, partial [Tepidiformaceae bacterium]|nr:DEAD/DEAH box helicase [Tepidiformaceae bacterium]
MRFFKFGRRRDETAPRSSQVVPTTSVAAMPQAQPISSAPEIAAAPHKRRRNRKRGKAAADLATGAPSASALPPALAPISDAFRDLGVDETGLAAIAALGYEHATPIQTESLPILLEGEDVVGLAQTGSGKTIAFGLPLARAIDPESNAVQGLVLVPTRELAHQVRDVLDHLGKFYGFATLLLVGGRPLRKDLASLEQGAQVVVGTPGRVMDHLHRHTLGLREVRFAVLDEADQMLDIGFARDIDHILRLTPKERQTALFSATMPTSIERLVYRYMRGARKVSVVPELRTAEGIAHYYCEVAERDKLHAMQYLYEHLGLGKSLVFRNTKMGVDRLTEQLRRAGVGAEAIHGDLRQSQRDRVMADFRSGRLEFLVATNVA